MEGQKVGEIKLDGVTAEQMAAAIKAKIGAETQAGSAAQAKSKTTQQQGILVSGADIREWNPEGSSDAKPKEVHVRFFVELLKYPVILRLTNQKDAAEFISALVKHSHNVFGDLNTPAQITQSEDKVV